LDIGDGKPPRHPIHKESGEPSSFRSILSSHFIQNLDRLFHVKVSTQFPQSAGYLARAFPQRFDLSQIEQGVPGFVAFQFAIRVSRGCLVAADPWDRSTSLMSEVYQGQHEEKMKGCQQNCKVRLSAN